MYSPLWVCPLSFLLSAVPDQDGGPEKDGGPEQDGGTDPEPIQFVSGTKMLNGTILISIKRNNLIEELPYIGKEFTVSFDLFISSFENAFTNEAKRFQSVFRLTLGRNDYEMGDRIPAIFLSPDKKLVVTSAISGNKNAFSMISGLEEKKWSKVEVTQRLKDGKVLLLNLNTSV